MRLNMRPRSAIKKYLLRTLKLLAALGLISVAPCSLPASFECAKTVSATEKLICSDPKTSALDNTLQETYKAALAATDANGKKALAKEQRNWIIYTRGMCQDVACLQKVYTDRIAVLARNEKNIENGEVRSYCELPKDDSHIGGGSCVNVLPYRDSNSRNDSFNQSLAQTTPNAKIIGCSKLIDLPVGNPNSNETFGGFCVVQEAGRRKNVAICNDNMAGHFEIRPVALQDTSDKYLINFTYAHCYGGL